MIFGSFTFRRIQQESKNLNLFIASLACLEDYVRNASTIFSLFPPFLFHSFSCPSDFKVWGALFLTRVCGFPCSCLLALQSCSAASLGTGSAIPAMDPGLLNLCHVTVTCSVLPYFNWHLSLRLI